MANINDFKLLNIKCKAYFDLLEKHLNRRINVKSEKHKERFGFYLFALESICNVRDISDILDCITDTEFNTDVFGNKNEDFGIDAIFIDHDAHYINLFNFKFRESFDENKKQSINETFLTAKFVNIIVGKDISGLKGKLKKLSSEIIECLYDTEVWKLKLYVVGNESVEIDIKSEEIKQLKKQYDLETEPIGLDKISKIMSIRPKPVNAIVHVDKSSVLPYAESKFSSSKSYIVKVLASELIRMTCDDENMRDAYNMENVSFLSDVDMEYDLLFDNVRGLILRSTFNEKILNTLQEEPGRFFMYNNGLTITASDVIAEETNLNQKIKITIKDFQVVNGGQTLRTLHKFNRLSKDNITNYLANCELLLRIFKAANENNIRNRIAEYTNSQNAISNIDLKSLSAEQIQIEQFLEQHGIVYARKIGDTGKPEKNYTHKISMEKFGQILFSIQGHPEKASNQKKQIFDKYYKDIFGEEKFDISKSATCVNRYFEIKKDYEEFGASENVEATDQKIFFILYLDGKLNISTKEKISFLEETIRNFNPTEDKQISEARKLIQVRFKEKLDNEIENLKK